MEKEFEMDNKIEKALNEILEDALRSFNPYRIREPRIIEKTLDETIIQRTIIQIHKNHNAQYYSVVFPANEIRFILCEASMLYSNVGRLFRTELLKKESIRGIASMDKSFSGEPMLPMAIIVLGKQNKETWFTRVSSMSTLVSVLLEIFPANLDVQYAANLTADNFSPNYYSEDSQKIQALLAGKKVVKLNDVADVLAGLSIPSSEYSDAGLPYLRGRDIQEGKIQKTYVRIPFTSAVKKPDCLLQSGDIILTKFFGQNKIAFISEDNVPAVASNGIFIIRPYGLPEKYLYKFLTSNTGKSLFDRQLDAIQKGVVIPSITLTDLKNVLIPVLDDITMSNIGIMESLDCDEMVDTIQRMRGKERLKDFLSKVRSFEQSLFQEISAGLALAGWDILYLERYNSANTTNARKQFCPDLVIALPDRPMVFIECKKDINAAAEDEVFDCLNNGTIMIITDGRQYRVFHHDSKSKSFDFCPSPELVFEKGVN